MARAVKFSKIIPQPLDTKAIKREIYNGMARFGRRAVKEFNKTVETWENEKPVFVYRVALHGTSHARSGPGPAVMIEMEGDEFGVQKWNWIDMGTEAHEEWAGYYTGKSDKKAMAFSSVFTPKNKVGAVVATTGGEGTIDTFRSHVHNPGITARNMRALLSMQLGRPYNEEMNIAMRRAVEESGHAM